LGEARKPLDKRDKGAAAASSSICPLSPSETPSSESFERHRFDRYDRGWDHYAGFVEKAEAEALLEVRATTNRERERDRERQRESVWLAASMNWYNIMSGSSTWIALVPNSRIK
jgi:hypothetical protein